MSKYRALGPALANRKNDIWRATFSELEQILGFALPDSAREYQAWWSNQSDASTHRHARVWQEAGWRTCELDLGSETVTFERVGTPITPPPAATPKHLGQTSTLPPSPDRAILDYVANPRPGRPYLVRFTAPEFTSLCPVTGQPDFAHLVIDYAPAATIVESKSLKLFLASFRNHAAFHEDCTVGIAERLFAEMAPLWLRIGGYWYPRGGIPIDVFWQIGKLPKGVWVPDQGVAPYRGRG